MTRREVFMVDAAEPFVRFREKKLETLDGQDPISQYQAHLLLAIAQYSRGDDLKHVRTSVQQAIAALENDPQERVEHFHLLDPEQYFCALWGLSLAMLFGDASPEFQRRASGQDALFDRLLRRTGALVVPVPTLLHPHAHTHLVAAFDQPEQAAQHLPKFLRSWYESLKDTNWHDSHLRQDPAFFGYWAFELAVVVKVLNLDDDTFADNIFYPRDLVHQRMFRTWLDTPDGEADRNARSAIAAQKKIKELKEQLSSFFQSGTAQTTSAESMEESLKLLSSLTGLKSEAITENKELLRASLVHLVRAILNIGQDAVKVSDPEAADSEGKEKLKSAFKTIEERMGPLKAEVDDILKKLPKDAKKKLDSTESSEELRARLQGLNGALGGLVKDDKIELEALLKGLEQLAATYGSQLGIEKKEGHNVDAEVREKLRKQFEASKKSGQIDENFDWSSLWKKE